MSILSLRNKSFVSPVVSVAVLLMVLFFSSRHTEKTQAQMSAFPDRFIPAINDVLNGDRDLYQARVAELQFVFEEEFDQNALRVTFEENAKQALDRFDTFRDFLAPYPDVTEQFTGFEVAYRHWYETAQRVFTLAENGNRSAAQALANGGALTAFGALRGIFNLAGEQALAKAATLKSVFAAEISANEALNWILVLLVVLVAIAGLISQLGMLRRVDVLTHTIRDIASGGGDLTRQVDVRQKDELGDLGLAFNSFVASLKSLMISVSTDVQRLNESSESLARAAQTALETSSRQSESTDSIVSAVHEMGIATKEVSNIAQTTADETEDATNYSNQGASAIQRSVTQVGKLYDSIEGAASGAKKLAEDSGKINGFLEVITGIAEQTNLLALNAAIEAARAGEQGRGFAVVADEVRALAGKTQESTKLIRQMIESVQQGVEVVVRQIEDNFERVRSSVDLSNESESLLSQTQVVIGRVKDMAIQTAAATEEQTAVTDNINNSLHDLSQQTQMNREVAEDTEATAAKIRALANSIREGVGRFKVA